MLDAPPMDTHLRYGEKYHVQAWKSSLHFEHERGLAGAIEHCNGQGVCKDEWGYVPVVSGDARGTEFDKGQGELVAWINYVHQCRCEEGVLHDEAIPNSTERLLRRSPWSLLRNDIIEATAQALNLCLACKGCKAECPSGVDMAKLKYEFENYYYKSHRRPLRDYVFGYFYAFANFASAIAPLSNVLLNILLFRKFAAKVLGITINRPFPMFASKKAKPVM